MVTEIAANVAAAAFIAVVSWATRGYYNKKKNSVFKFVRRLKVLKSGAQGYYFSFPVEDNKKVWKEVRKRFCYLGLTSNTIIDELLGFMRTEQGKSLEYRFLLMNPEAKEVILRQEAYRFGYRDFSNLESKKRSQLDGQTETTMQTILTCVARIKQTDCFSEGRVKIKLFAEFVPWWMYFFDDARIFLGLLEFAKDGRDSPLVILERNPEHPTLYNAFENVWERMWQDGVNV